MRELLEQIRINLWAVVHHRWIALVGAFLICAAGWTAVAMMPNEFEVDTQFFLDTQTVLKPLLKGIAVNNPVRSQAAALMQRTLTARPYLEEVARQADLTINASTPAQKEALLSSLRNGLRIRGARIASRSDNMYQLSFTDPDPKKAKKIVEAFLNIFVEHVLQAGRQDTEGASRFLDQQIADYAKRLDAADNRLTKFKQEHPGVSPGNGGTYYQRLYQLQGQLADAQLRLRMAQHRAAEIKQQMDEAASNASGQSGGPVMTPLDRRIQKLEDNLTQLKLKYTDKYPDVVQTEAVLKQLREQQKQEQKEAAKNPGKASPALAQSKAYQDLQVMRGQAEGDVAALQARVQEYQRRISDLQSKVTTVPEIEAAYEKLRRNYGVIKKTYQELVQRKQSAELATNAAQSTDASQFRIVEPPVIPATPQKPNRFILLTMVLIGGVVGGIGLAWLYAQFKPAIYTRSQLERITTYPILGSVSMIWTPAERAARRMGVVGISGALVCLILVYGGLMAHYGLDLGPVTDGLRSLEGHLRALGGKVL